ncbi:MAG TPA: PEGA domain-containing protein, partial [Polyangiaceae bacterium]|nr:PEGA domain-containing protein [Polyangiaceae bacterium]
MQRLPASVRVVLVALAVSGAARSSLAADPPSDEALSEARRNEAKAKYQAGVEAYDKHRYKDAVDLFLEADKAAPSAALSFNIGRAYERLGDDTSALRWYRDYLRRSVNAPNAAAVRETVEKLAVALSKKGLQQVTVLSSPAGATVTVDEQAVGVTPWTGELSPGKHQVLLTLRGYSDGAQEFELRPTEPLDLSLRLEAATPV